EALRAFDGAADEEERRTAAHALRFFDTERGVAEIAARAGAGAGEYELEFALYGSQHPEAAGRAMEEPLDAPAFPGSGTVLRALAWMRGKLERPARLGPYPNDNPLAAELWQATAREAREGRDALLASYAARLVDRLPRKSRAARAACVNALLSVASQGRG